MLNQGFRDGVSRLGRLYLFRESWAKAVDNALSSPALIRFGAVTLILAGAIGLAADVLSFVAMSRAYGEYSPTAQAVYEGSALFTLASFLRGTPVWLLISAGLLGICGLLSDVRGRPLKLALAGAVLALVSISLMLALYVLESLALGASIYEGLAYLPFVPFLFWVLPVAILLSGVSALWARSLGCWRFLPLAVCLSSTPLSGFLVFLAYSGGSLEIAGPTGLEFDVLFMSPEVVANLGWILLGCVMVGARKREAARTANEQRMREADNLILARRLYVGAWGGETSRWWTIWSPRTLWIAAADARGRKVSNRPLRICTALFQTSISPSKSRPPKEIRSRPAALSRARTGAVSSGIRLPTGERTLQPLTRTGSMMAGSSSIEAIPTPRAY